MKELKLKVRTIPDFPKEGVMFRDITTLLKDPEGFKRTVDEIFARYKDMDIDLIVGIESRGFILGGAIAHRLGKGFVPARKPGKLPGETHSVEYDLEYGTDKLEIHKDSIEKGDKVLIVDDLLATGGTCKATIELVEYLGGVVVECVFVIALPELGGLELLKDYPVHYLLEFEGK